MGIVRVASIVLVACASIILSGCGVSSAASSQQSNRHDTQTLNFRKDKAENPPRIHASASNIPIQSISRRLVATIMPFKIHNVQIKYVDPSNGWAFGYIDDHLIILKSVQPKQQWQVVRLKAHFPMQSDYGLGGSFTMDPLDKQTVILAWTLPHSHSVHYAKTIDGGVTWEVSTSLSLPDPTMSVEQLDFVNKLNGWILIQSIGWSGHSNKWIYHSSNGGLTWKMQVNGEKFTRMTNGYTSRLAFTSIYDGWWIMDDPIDSGVSLYRTSNSGDTWSRVALDIPKSLNKYTTSIISASFSNKNISLLIAFSSVKNGKSVSIPVLISSHSTRSWHLKVLNKFVASTNSVEPIQAAFMNLKSNIDYVISNWKLFESHDGGIKWESSRSIPHDRSDSKIDSFSFSSRLNAILLESANKKSSLYATDTGGRSWTFFTNGSVGRVN